MQALYAERYGAGRYADAAAFCARSVAIQPGNADDHCNHGEILVRLDRRRDAACAFARAIALAPSFGPAHHKRGLNGQLIGEADAARASYDRAAVLMPGSAEIQVLRLISAIERAGSAEIPALVSRLLAIPARTAEELLLVGSVLGEKGYHREAVRALSRALALKPDAFDCWVNRGIALAGTFRHHEAVNGARRALAIRPSYPHAHTNLIFWIGFLPEFGFAEHQAERRKWSMAQRRGVPAPAPHPNTSDPDRKLRLGYVSSDFKGHATAGVFGPVLRRHDRSRFDLFLYSGTLQEDGETERFRKLATAWRSTLGLSPDTLAERIRADRIDILIDLSGHTAGNHLSTFLRKPAPVQVTAWGSSTGTGLSEIDYFLADPVAVPEDVRHHFAEAIYDIPGLFPCETPERLPPVSALPATQSGSVVYGCFNRATKIGPIAVMTWARILRQVPDARLFLKDRAFGHAYTRDQLRDELVRHGARAGQLEFAGGTAQFDHLAAHERVDIALDPFPQNGGVTTCQSLMMGVPVVALLGDDPGARTSASLLSAIGYADWVAPDVDRYVDIAAEWSARIPELSVIRQGLRARYLDSPIGNLDLYTRLVEDAFREMWRRWCEGRSPRSVPAASS